MPGGHDGNSQTDYYRVLGVDGDAEHETIRRAYLEAARRWHPDAMAQAGEAQRVEAEKQMRAVNEAWHVLGSAPRRRAYDARRSVRPLSSPPVNGGVRVDDGVTRIDPRLLDPEFLAARRSAQQVDISNRQGMVVRALPLVAILALLGGILVLTAYGAVGRTEEGGDPAHATPATVAGPNLGAGIEAGDCVSVVSGPGLLKRPCDPLAAGRVVGAHAGDGSCPVGTVREVELLNGFVACLARP